MHTPRVDLDASSCGDSSLDNARYLDELVKDMRELNAMPGAYPHALRLLNEEIDRVWSVLYTSGGLGISSPSPRLPYHPVTPPRSLLAPIVPQRHATTPPAAAATAFPHLISDADGVITLQEKIPIPMPKTRCNFIGRILGPRGISVKQLEGETGCHILVRGKGSVKDPFREERLTSTPGWEHLAEPLHVLIKATDLNTMAAEAKLRRGIVAIQRLLTPLNDEHKRRQLVQLAIINGTYRSES